MSTSSTTSNFSAALFGQTRRALLALLYGHPDEAYYLRQLVRAGGLGLGAVQREVKRLAEAGILRRTVRGHQVYYQANPECPVFAELKGLAVKTAGPADTRPAPVVPEGMKRPRSGKANLGDLSTVML
jgi:DNA-binding transcriptional ArsR family regulator